jgi:hypothetical protein
MQSLRDLKHSVFLYIICRKSVNCIPLPTESVLPLFRDIRSERPVQTRDPSSCGHSDPRHCTSPQLCHMGSGGLAHGRAAQHARVEVHVVGMRIQELRTIFSLEILVYEIICETMHRWEDNI